MISWKDKLKNEISGGVIVLLLSLTGPGAAAETLIVPVSPGESGAVESEASTGQLFMEDSQTFGETADGRASVLVMGFDVSFLPPGATVESAVLVFTPFEDAWGDITSLGTLRATVTRPLLASHAYPNRQPDMTWAGGDMGSWVPVVGDLTEFDPVTADITGLVNTRLQEVTSATSNDPGHLIVCLAFDRAPSENGSRDLLFADFISLRLTLDLGEEIAERPVARHTLRGLPVVASNRGKFDTQWKTSLFLHNEFNYPVAVWLYFTPTETDGRTSFTVRRVDLQPFSERSWDDVLPDLFGLSDTKGWIEVLTTVPWLGVSARVANIAGEGSYGQTVPLATEDNIIPYGMRISRGRGGRVLPQILLEDGWRNNIGFFNFGSKAVTVMLSLFSGEADGPVVGTVGYDLLPFSNVQLPSLSTYHPDLAGRGLVTGQLWIHSAWGNQVLPGTYLSRVDNITGDAAFVLSQ